LPAVLKFLSAIDYTKLLSQLPEASTAKQAHNLFSTQRSIVSSKLAMVKKQFKLWSAIRRISKKLNKKTSHQR